MSGVGAVRRKSLTLEQCLSLACSVAVKLKGAHTQDESGPICNANKLCVSLSVCSVVREGSELSKSGQGK